MWRRRQVHEAYETIRSNVTFVDLSKVAIKEKYTILIKLKDESHQFMVMSIIYQR